MSLPKGISCDCEVVDDPDEVCPKHQDILWKALSIAWEFMKTQVHIAEAQKSEMHPIRYQVGADALEAMRQIEELGKP